MATVNEINNQLQDLKNQREKFSSSSPNENGVYIIDGKEYTLDEITQQGKVLDRKIKKIEKVIAPYLKAQRDYQAAQAELARAREIAASPITESPTGISTRQAGAGVSAAAKKVASTKAKFESASTATYKIPAGEGETPTVGGESTMTEAETLASRAGLQRLPKAAPKTSKKPGKPSTGGVGGGLPKAPGESVGETTVRGGKTFVWNGTAWVQQGKLSTEEVITKFKSMFPSQAWIADIDPAKYPGVRSLLERAVTGQMWKSPEGQLRFKTEWESSDFFTELKTNDQVKTIKSLVGDLGFDSVPFNQFLTTSMNMGWKGDELKAEVYKEVFRRDDTDKFVNPTAVERVKKSNPYLSVAKIGKEYFSSVDDRDIQRVLTGEMIVDDVQRKQRELAKTKYAHLGSLIDQGFTLQELSDPFRQQAAQLLEKTPDSIDMGEAMFEAAYNYGEPDKKRMMTSGEWEIMLRSDAKYGWDKTNNAKQEARQLATSIAQAFGRVI